MNVEYIYKDRNNTIDIELLESGVNIKNVQYEAIRRMTLDFDGVVLDSDNLGMGIDLPFDWISNDRLTLRLGFSVVTVPSGVYQRVKHIVYSSDNQAGVIWGYLNIAVIE